MKAARALRWARLTAGLSQRQLAEKSGLPQSTIGRIEAGLVDPRVGTLSKLLRACGYDLEVLERIGIGVDRTLMRPVAPERGAEALAVIASSSRNLRRFVASTRGETVTDPDVLFDPGHAIRTLVGHDVKFVVADGVAACLLGSPTFAEALDVCPEPSVANADALASALRALRAIPGGGESFDTQAGRVCCLDTPSGSGGYADLARKATRFRLDDLEFAVVSLDDLIRMKRAAGRPKDRIELEIRGALRDEIDGEPP
jgi:transcriptional regulator with XRE-family HTH domain